MHLRSWLVWVGSVAIVTLSTRNPFYLALTLMVAQIVSMRAAMAGGVAVPNWWLRFGMIVVPVSALFNAVSVHFGDTVLLTIPGSIPLLSGIVTLEALIYGALNGVLITVVIAVFAIFNIAIPAYQLVRSTPRTFQSIGITVGIALSFIPQTMRRLNEVREAQSVRGHRVRGVRDWLPLWLPLLIGGLEQSTQLSEAMVARGFGATRDQTTSLQTRVLFAVGLGLVLVGWLISFVVHNIGAVSTLLMIAGAVFVLVGLWLSGRAVPHTIYNPQKFKVVDACCVAACLLNTALLVVPNPFISQMSLFYYPYPHIIAPTFDPIIGALMLLWLLPLAALRPPPINTQAS